MQAALMKDTFWNEGLNMHDLIRRRPKMSLKLDRVVEIHSPWSTSSRYNKISMKEVNNRRY